jgi:hypothetical protein
MKAKESRSAPNLEKHKKHIEDQSRRQFLQTAVAVGTVAVAAAAPITGIAQAGREELSSSLNDPLEKILDRYGSEFGDLDRIG